MSARFSNHKALDRMAWTIAEGGFGSVSATALRELGFEARRVGVHPAITQTLADETVPLVVRQRAFGHIASKLAGGRSHTTHATDVAA